MKNKLTLLTALLLLGLSYGCKKDLAKIPEDLPRTEIKVEEKVYNPYSVENMQKAMSSLMMKDVQLLAHNKEKYANGKVMSTNSTAPLAINKA